MFSYPAIQPPNRHDSLLQPPIQPNRFIYMKQNLFDNQPPTTSKKVLINPNFKPTSVHINPNFKGAVESKINVYINPNFNTAKNDQMPKISNDVGVNDKEDFIAKPIVSTKTKLIRNLGERLNLRNSRSVNQNLSNKYKYVKSKDSSSRGVNKNKVELGNRFKIDRRIETESLCKVPPLNQNFPVKKITPPKSKMSLPNSNKLKTKYKLVNNVNRKVTVKTPKAYKTILNVGRINPKVKFISLNGKLYRRSKTSLKKVAEDTQAKCKSKIYNSASSKYKINKVQGGEVLRINGPNKVPFGAHGNSKYCLRRNVNSVKHKNSKSNKIRLITVVKSKYKKINKCDDKSGVGKKLLLCKTRFKLTQVASNKLKSSNLPCPMYRKYGRCNGKENGKCIRKHNSDQIALCTKFLQGACHKENCLLSHKISLEKMPACKFYLEGLCSKENCPYLHVKISPKADICKDFVEGFCAKGKDCDERHQYLCPDFEKNGKCPKRKCPYPHGSREKCKYADVAKKFKYKSGIVGEKDGGKYDETNEFNKHKENSCKDGIDGVDNSEVSERNVRYFAEVNSNLSVREINSKVRENENEMEVEKKMQTEVENVNEVQNVIRDIGCDEIVSDCDTIVKKRPKLGALPSFIPFMENS